MNKNLKLRAIVWEIIVPIVLYYIVFLSAMYFIFAFIGHTASTYMIAQIISAAITIPFMYFASYKPTQQMFVKKPKIDRALFINVLWVIVITLFISFALNNIITMSPLIGLSEGYARANESFYASTLVIELIGSAILSPIMEELVFRGGLTVAYMAKLYICIFWQKHPTRQAEFDGMTHYMNGTTAFALLGSAAALPFLGALPGLLLTPFGARSASFFGVPALKEAIAYFSAENLQGAAISIIIGAAVYLLIVLPLLTRKDESGVRLYVNRWNEKLDLENAVYRPLLLTLLPQVLTLVFRFIAELPENLVMASRATIFRMRKTRKPVPVGNRFTYTLGRALNALARLLNRTILHRHPMRTDFEYVLDASFREVSSGIRSMSVSISFGLLLLCIGLYVTCLYLLQ